MTRHLIVAAIGVCAMLKGASAQSAPPAGPAQTGQPGIQVNPGTDGGPVLTPVEPGVADVNALATSLRVIQPGLTQPQGFSGVYTIEGREDLYVRASGGLYAVFPQSAYATNDEGEAVAMIPAGTVFYIGEQSLRSLVPGAEARMPSPEAVHARQETRQLVEGVRPDPNRAPVRLGVQLIDRSDRELGEAGHGDPERGMRTPNGRIVFDEAYRSSRVRELMDRAAEAAAAENAADTASRRGDQG